MRMLAIVLVPLLLCQDGAADLVARARRESRLGDAALGVSIFSVKAGASLYEEKAGDPLVLGSNAKLLTTAAALARLGPDCKFQTTVGLEGGDLHVFGGGDPNISGRFHDDDPTAIFKGWAQKLRDAKVDKVGALVLHAGFFDKVWLHPDWVAEKHPQDQWWCAPVGALSLNDNCVDVLYEAGAREGDPVKITRRPDTGYVTIKNRTRTVKSKNPKPIGFSRKSGTNEISAVGELRVGTKQRVAWVAIEDPTRYFGTVLKETLERSGIAVGEIRESEDLLKDHPGLKVVAVHESDLASAVRVCNTVSQNFHAEMICKLLGAKLKGQGSSAAGVEAIREFMEKDVGAADVKLADGCGLSRGDRAPAAAVLKLLDYVRRQSYAQVFRDSLAVSGTDPGTLRRRMKSIKGAVHAKTGHIDGVSALSGYLDTSHGDTIIFSIICNDWKKGSPNDFQDRLLEMLHAQR